MNELESTMGMYGFRDLFRVLWSYGGVAKIFSEVRTTFQMPLLFLQVADHRDVLRFASRIFRNVQHMFQKKKT